MRAATARSTSASEGRPPNLTSDELVWLRRSGPEGETGVPTGALNPPIPSPPSDPTDPPRTSTRLFVARALLGQWKQFRRRWRQCERNFSEETVHDARVGARRLIAQIRALEEADIHGHTRKALRSLKRGLKAMSELRDVQVQRDFLTRRLGTHPALAGIWLELCRREKRLIRRGSRAARRLDFSLLEKKVLEIAAEIARPSAAAPPDGLASGLMRATQRCFQRVVERSCRIQAAQPATIHKTRIALKRFRYMVESLPPHVIRPPQRQIAALAELQTLMGNIQDLDVLLGFIDEFVAARPGLSSRFSKFRSAVERLRVRRIRRLLLSVDQVFSLWPMDTATTDCASGH